MEWQTAVPSGLMDCTLSFDILYFPCASIWGAGSRRHICLKSLIYNHPCCLKSRLRPENLKVKANAH